MSNSSEKVNRDRVEAIGRGKVIRALSEVARKLDPEEPLQPLLDRAYEIGYRPEADGLVKFNAGIQLGNETVDGIIDTDAAPTIGQARDLGYISEEEHERVSIAIEGDTDASNLATGEESESSDGGSGAGIVQPQEYYTIYYALLSSSGSTLFSRSGSSSYWNLGYLLNVRRINQALGTSNAGQTYYQPPANNSSGWGTARWSRLRWGLGPHPVTGRRQAQNFYFNQDVMGRAAQVI